MQPAEFMGRAEYFSSGIFRCRIYWELRVCLPQISHKNLSYRGRSVHDLIALEQMALIYLERTIIRMEKK